jgi:hypothetical protein
VVAEQLPDDSLQVWKFYHRLWDLQVLLFEDRWNDFLADNSLADEVEKNLPVVSEDTVCDLVEDTVVSVDTEVVDPVDRSGFADPVDWLYPVDLVLEHHLDEVDTDDDPDRLPVDEYYCHPVLGDRVSCLEFAHWKGGDCRVAVLLCPDDSLL